MFVVLGEEVTNVEYDIPNRLYKAQFNITFMMYNRN